MILFFIAAAASAPLPVELTTPEVARDRIMACGLGAVSIRSDKGLQSDTLVVDARSATDAQLGCVDHAAGYFDVDLEPTIQPRFKAIRDARLAQLALVEARTWLSARKLLNHLPAYQTGATDDAVFCQKLENLCGPRAKGAFKSVAGVNTFNIEWLRREIQQGPPDSEVFGCLMHAAVASGFTITIIGNEAVSKHP